MNGSMFHFHIISLEANKLPPNFISLVRSPQFWEISAVDSGFALDSRATMSPWFELQLKIGEFGWFGSKKTILVRTKIIFYSTWEG